MSIPKPRRGTLPTLLAIAAILLALALAFAWAGGWIGQRNLTPQTMVNTVEAGGSPHPGFRRAHSKGICIVGSFAPAPAAARLSTARVFTQASTPVLGRFSNPGNDPYAPDNKAAVRGMALQLKTDDGQEWRMAMNSFPFFAAATPEGFQAMNAAKLPDPATGKPDPEKMKAVLARHPEIARFMAWSKNAQTPDSLANTRFNGVNAFRLTDAGGTVRTVRWSMRPHTPFVAADPEQLKTADRDYLAADLDRRLAAGPLQWDLVMQFAAPGDPIEDPSQAWPDTRPETTAGTLTLVRAEPQVKGPCLDLNFDPLILPKGISGTDDPVLHARSSVYSVSFNRREREISQGNAKDGSKP
ncbi:catalase family peroxidase [Massilia forsythiae]|uniref:Catalase-related peroxidase n=1 Tax=Massilia forsythiae TaxID=2728020 RepID=A0A7Z2VUE3_9BURK|nr:catalase family peroxidase [Massilia forsythiae]QJD99375.1 catalase family peroxidase [Massilia forsythiae]